MLIETSLYPDERGFFAELFHAEAFRDGGIPLSFVQDNFSYSHRYVLRGLHYQLEPYAQGKLISVLAGEIFDCAVDIRTGAPTFGNGLDSISKRVMADFFIFLLALLTDSVS